ncbi:MAG: YdcF family protein [Polyangiaceae bacterium]
MLVALVGCWLVYAAALALFGVRDDTGPADAAVILGNRVEADGRPSWILEERLRTGLALFQSGRVKVLIVSGGFGAEGYSEARVMGDWLRARGVPPEAVIEDADGSDTRATMKNAAAVARDRGFTSLIVVSHFFHVPRCELAARAAGVRGVSRVHAQSSFRLRHLYSLARETVALPAYWLRG